MAYDYKQGAYLDLPIKANMTEGYFGENWSQGLIHKKPNIYPEIMKLYPDEEALFLTATRLAGNVIKVPSDHVTVYYKGAIQRTVSIGVIATLGAAGALSKIKLSQTTGQDYDPVSGTSFLRVGFTLYVPSQFTNTPSSTGHLGFYVQSYGTDGVNGTLAGIATEYTIIPKGNYTLIAGAAGNAVCMVGDSSYGIGDGQPKGIVSYEYEETFHPQLSKETVDVAGGIAEIQRWQDELRGGKETVLEGTEYAHIRLDSQIETAFWLGQKADPNYPVTSLNNEDGSSTILGTEGIIPQLDTDGMALPYDPSNYKLETLKAIKFMMESQLVASKTVKGFAGPDYMSNFETGWIDYLKESSYTDLTTINNGMRQVGYPVGRVHSNGMNIDFFNMPTWGKPNSMGHVGSPFRSLAVFMPDTQATARIGNKEAQEVTMNNVTLGFVANHGVDRTRVIRIADGMTGRSSSAVNGYDRERIYMLSHYMWMIFYKNQMIISKPIATAPTSGS
jgi:hypothetical protein